MAQSAVAATHRDRRAAERIPTSLRGKVFATSVERAAADPLADPFDCVFADFSKLGARLRFDGAAPEGERLTVVVWSSGVAFEAQVRWRRGAEIGVQFASSRDLRRPAPPHLAQIQALWMRRRPRVGRRALIASPVILQNRTRSPRRLPPPG